MATQAFTAQLIPVHFAASLQQCLITLAVVSSLLQEQKRKQTKT